MHATPGGKSIAADTAWERSLQQGEPLHILSLKVRDGLAVPGDGMGRGFEWDGGEMRMGGGMSWDGLRWDGRGRGGMGGRVGRGEVGWGEVERGRVGWADLATSSINIESPWRWWRRSRSCRNWYCWYSSSLQV